MHYDMSRQAWDLDGRTLGYTSIAQGEYSVSADPDAVITHGAGVLCRGLCRR